METNGWKYPLVAEWKRILFDFQALEAVDHLPEGHDCVPMIWVCSQKKNASGEDTRKKARLVAAQTLEKYWYEKDEKFNLR